MFKSTIYSVVEVRDFLKYLMEAMPQRFRMAPESILEDMMQAIADSGAISFGDAFDTLITAERLCYILEIPLPGSVEPNTLIGLGS